MCCESQRLSEEARTILREVRASTVLELRGLEGDERRAALRSSAERHAELARRFESEPGAAARAWYECAELWRRQGSLGKADAAYRSTLEHDRGGAYEERALFGRAQMLRRQKMLDRAIAAYQQAAAVKPGSNRAHESRLWIARCLDGKGESEKSLAAFRSALEAAERPRQVITRK